MSLSPSSSYSSTTLIIVILSVFILLSSIKIKLLLFSPLFLLFGGISYVVLDVYLSHWFDQLIRGRLKGDGVKIRNQTGTSSNSTIKRYRSIPVFKFTTPSAWSMTQIKYSWESNCQSTSLYSSLFPSSPPLLNESLQSLFQLVLRDFILRWYSPLINKSSGTTTALSHSFPNVVEANMLSALKNICQRVVKVDWSDVIVGKILPLVTDHMEMFGKAELELRRGSGTHNGTEENLGEGGGGNKSSRRKLSPLTESPELSLFLSAKYASLTLTGKLHPAVDSSSPNSKPEEEVFLRTLVEKILPLVMEEKEISSPVVGIMTREVIACAILANVTEGVCDEDFWNRLIDEKAGAAIRDQKMVTQFREALDAQNVTSLAHSSTSSKSTTIPSKSRRTEEISAKTSAKQFELFVKGIGKCNSLLDARRLRSDVGSQIRKTLVLVDGRSKEEIVDGQKVSELLHYIERLLVAQKKADKRIEELGGEHESINRNNLINLDSTFSHSHITLREILLSPTALSYFMEHQDRRNRSLRVQFWLLVESLKAPLEDGDFDEAKEKALLLPLPKAGAIETTREDMRMIWDTYFEKNVLKSNHKYTRVVKDFLESVVVTALDLRRVKKAVYSAQNDVLKEMEEEDFESFKKSDLFFKALVNIPSTLTGTSIPNPPLASTTLSSVPQIRSRTNTTTSPTSTPPLPYQSIFQRSNSPPPPLLPLSSSTRPLIFQQQQQRTETAPPQVSFQDLHYHQPMTSKGMRRTGSEERVMSMSRKSSAASMEGYFGLGIGGIGAGAGAGAGRKRGTALSDSLDFLMSPPSTTIGENDGSRSPLFDEEREADLGIDEEDYVQIQTIEAIQEALNSILATDAKSSGIALSQGRTSLSSSQELLLGNSGSGTVGRHFSSDSTGMRKPSPSSNSMPASRPGTPSLGLSSSTLSFTKTSTSSTTVTNQEVIRKPKRVFDDYEDLEESDRDESEEVDFDPKDIIFPAPGDLELPSEIARLGTLIDKLKNQELVVDKLIRKADLTGAPELKILTKSRESLRREMKALEFQKVQYETQESQNQLLPDKTFVLITGTTIGRQTNGQSYQLYLVEVHQSGSDGKFGSGWIVTRRYSEFAMLHANLKEKFGSTAKILDLPSKRLVTSYSEGFVEQRRIGLEKFLQSIVKISAICQSSELRSFLSQQNISLPNLDPIDSSITKRTASNPNITLFPGQSLVRSLYRTVTSGLDDVFITGPSSMMDTIISTLLVPQQSELASTTSSDRSNFLKGGVQEEDLVGVLAGKSLNSGVGVGEEGLSYFTGPICDFFLTLFELKEKNNWLRRQAIVIILQQVLGGTIERKFRDAVKMVMAQDQLLNYIELIKNGIWPQGQLKPKALPRTAEERLETRESANRKLSALMPDVAANLIGRANARHGARRIFAVLQNRRLNKHLLYSIIDELVSALFPELDSKSTTI